MRKCIFNALVETGRGIVSTALNLQARLQQQLNRTHWHIRNRKPRRTVRARADCQAADILNSNRSEKSREVTKLAYCRIELCCPWCNILHAVRLEKYAKRILQRSYPRQFTSCNPKSKFHCFIYTSLIFNAIV